MSGEKDFTGDMLRVLDVAEAIFDDRGDCSEEMFDELVADRDGRLAVLSFIPMALTMMAASVGAGPEQLIATLRTQIGAGS